MCTNPFRQVTQRRSDQTEDETIQNANQSDDNLNVTQGREEHTEQLTEIEQLKDVAEINLEEPKVFHKKEQNSRKVERFRNIPLLNIEGKIFMAVLAKRTTRFLLSNEYIDMLFRKGGIPEVSVCIENTSVLTQILRAKEKKSDIAVLRLDLADAYGSIPHKLVDLILERLYVPTTIRAILQEYYDRIEMKFTAGIFITS
ncbi:unnamed protein product [Mytilus coruscus]|uniref:Uncharacterized protein n=1 Tax=Mytilus coruscus TaxID=42192 RepID=A0A6J8D124_MYTCO|nr:unnamed protein product [Mytilus coruscus]